MPVADLAEDRQVLFRRIDHAAGMADRLDHNGRHGRRIFHADHVLDDGRAGDSAVGVRLAERAPIAGRWKDVNETRGHRLVDRLPRLEARGRKPAQGRAMPGLVAADDLVLARRAGQPVVLPRQLDRRLDDLGTAALKLDRRKIARRELGQQVGQLDGLRVGAVHRRRKRQSVELLLDRVNDPAIVMSHGDDVDARDRVEIALAVHVPVADAVGSRHHEWMFGEFGHLVANEDLSEEGFLGGLSLFDQVGNSRGGHFLVSSVDSSSPWMGRSSASATLGGRETFRSRPPSWGRVTVGGIRNARRMASFTMSPSSIKCYSVSSQYSIATVAYSSAIRTKSSISTHSATVC